MVAMDDLGGSCQISKELDVLMATLKAELISLYDMRLVADLAKLQANEELRLREQRSVASASCFDQVILSNQDVGSCKHQVDSISQDEEAAEQPSPSLMPEAQHLAAPLSDGMAHLWSVMPQWDVMSVMPEASGAPLSFVNVRAKSFQRRVMKRSYGVFSPHSLFVTAWGTLLSGFTVLCLWADSLASVETFPGGFGPFGYWWEVLVVCLFSFDIILNFNIAVEDRSFRTYSYARWDIAKIYMKSWFLIDLLTTIPFSLIFSASANRLGRLARMAKVMKALKAFRLAKIAKIIWSHGSLEFMADLWDNWLSNLLASEDGTASFYRIARFVGALLRHLLLIYIQSHVLACFVLSNQSTPDLRWVDGGVAASDLSVWRRYIVSIGWAFTLIATGFDDPVLDFLHPSGGVIILKITATCLHAVLIIFAMGALPNRSDDMDFNFRMTMMNSYLRLQGGITNSTRKKVLNSFKSQRHARVRENLCRMIAEELDPNLRYDVLTDIFGPFFESFNLFNQFPFTESFGYNCLITDLCGMTTTHFFSEGEKIISAARNPGGMIFMISGQSHYEYPDSKDPPEGQDQQATASPSASMSGHLSLADWHGKFNFPKSIKQFHAVECLFSSAGLNMHPEYDLIADSKCEIGKVSRKHFDELLLSAQYPPKWLSFVNFIRAQVGDDTISPSTLQTGVDEDVIQRWELTEIDRNFYSLEDWGVALAYLQHQFKHDLRSEVGALDFTSTSFSDLGKYLWTSGVHRGFRGSADKICPRDGLKGTSLVDALHQHEKGIATYFVSWCWCYTVDMMVSALGTWAMGHNVNSSQCYFWMCFFCNNQRKLLVDKEQQDLAKSFSSRLLRIGKMIMVFNKYTNSEYTQRIWCIYEVFTASKNDITLSLAMPENCQVDFRKQLQHGNLTEMIESLRNISVESAEATRPQDKQQILGLIKSSTGFEAVNESVKCALMSWLTGAFQECLQENMTSEPARIIAGLVLKGTGHAREFDCHDWEVAVKRHPGLMHYFEFDADLPPKDAFKMLSESRCQRVNIQVLDSFLHQRKSNSVLIFAKWLHDWSTRDSELAGIADDVLRRVHEENQAMQTHLQEHTQLLMSLKTLSHKHLTGLTAGEEEKNTFPLDL